MFLKFGEIKIEKKEFHKSKQQFDLDLVNVDQIVISGRFKHNDDGFKYFIDYEKDDIVRSVCTILPQMKGYIKYFENGKRNISLIIKDDSVLVKYNEIWNKIKKTLSMPVHDEKHIKVKVREFNGVTKTNFWGDKISKENVCIALV